MQQRLERGYRRQPVIDHRLIDQLTAQSTPAELGASSWHRVLSEALRISQGEAKRRIKLAGLLGPRRSLTGEVLAPQWAQVAAAQARGELGAEHVRIIETFFDEVA